MGKSNSSKSFGCVPVRRSARIQARIRANLDVVPLKAGRVRKKAFRTLQEVAAEEWERYRPKVPFPPVTFDPLPVLQGEVAGEVIAYKCMYKIGENQYLSLSDRSDETIYKLDGVTWYRSKPVWHHLEGPFVANVQTNGFRVVRPPHQARLSSPNVIGLPHFRLMRVSLRGNFDQDQFSQFICATEMKLLSEESIDEAKKMLYGPWYNLCHDIYETNSQTGKQSYDGAPSHYSPHHAQWHEHNVLQRDMYNNKTLAWYNIQGQRTRVLHKDGSIDYFNGQCWFPDGQAFAVGGVFHKKDAVDRLSSWVLYSDTGKWEPRRCRRRRRPNRQPLL